jgi:hypothetical protein
MVLPTGLYTNSALCSEAGTIPWITVILCEAVPWLDFGAVEPPLTYPVQVGANYAALANDGALVVQFPAGRSALDFNLLGDIQQTYGSFVPRHVWESSISIQ